MGQFAETLRFLPGRLLVRAVWALRRRLATRPPAAALLRAEIAREQRRLAAIDLGLERLPALPVAEPGGDLRLWSLTPPLFRRAQVPGHGAAPEPGAALGPLLKLYHDHGPGAPQIFWRQRPDPAAGWGAQALALVVYAFPGRFVSLVVEVPAELAAAAAAGHRVALSFQARATRPVPLFLRLNLMSDLGSASLHDVVILTEGARAARFDLAAAAEVLRAPARIWLDLILEAPEMVELDLARLRLALVRPGGAE